MTHIAGIDLGTTFSGIAVLNSIGRPEIVPNAAGERITPSVLYFPQEEAGKVLVGREALNARKYDVKRSARWIKRYMGDAQYPTPIDGKYWSPAELSSFLLRRLKEDASRQVGPIEDVVITVPAYFDEVRRKATMDAGRMAGLNVVGIVNEPTAAALYYAVTHEVTGRILVFDLGGGTFDVTVMNVAGQKIDIVTSRGDHQLGGYDLDQMLLEEFDRTYRIEKGAGLYATAEDRAVYEDEAEDVKKTLSSRPRARKMLTGSAGSARYEITREEFEGLMGPFMSRIEMLVEAALDEAHNRPDEIDRVLLVGGSTRIPLVRERLEKMFGFPPTFEVNVDECVALGAALHAGLRLVDHDATHATARVPTGVAAGLSDIKLKEVCNHDYGTIIINFDRITGRPVLENDIIIRKNTAVPCQINRTYYTMFPGQVRLEADVTQGEDIDPEYVLKIASGALELPPGRPAGRPVEVTYSYDSNERMHCLFTDVESGRRLVMDIDTQAGGVSQHEVARRQSDLGEFVVE